MHFFAKRADSVEEANSIIMDDIFRIMACYDTEVALKNEHDGYGDWIITVKTKDDDNFLTYKVCNEYETEEK